MHIKWDDDEFDEKKTVKLQLPKGQLVRLKSQKVLTGETLSEIAGKALAEYFEEAQSPDATSD